MTEPYIAFLEIRRSGDLVAADEYLRSLPRSSWALAAQAQLLSVRGGAESMVRRLLHEAESLVGYDDFYGHMELFKAYELGLGCDDFEQSMLDAHRHLLAAAACDSGIDAVLAVARRLSSGTAVIDANPAEALRWYDVAKSRGSVEAAKELKVLKARIH